MVGMTAPEPQYGATYCGYQLRCFGEQPHEIDGFCRLRAGRGHELKDRPEHHQRQRYPHPSQIQQSRGPHQDACSHDRSDNTCCTEEGSLDERLLEVCGSETDVKGGAEGEPAHRRRAAYRPNPATAKTPRDSGDRRAESQRAVGKEVANPSPWVCPSALASALALALAPLPLAPLPSWIRNALSLNRAVSVPSRSATLTARSRSSVSLPMIVLKWLAAP